MLAPILAAGPHAERKPYDSAAAEKPREGDLDIDDVGEEVKMPWEADGRRWHTHDRVARNGEPCRWDGRILAAWSTRFTSSATSRRPTGQQPHDRRDHRREEERRLVLPRHHRRRVAAEAQVPHGQAHVQARRSSSSSSTCKPLNEMPDLPIYGNEPRVKCKNLRGPWQEVQLAVHAWDEIDTPAFW